MLERMSSEAEKLLEENEHEDHCTGNSNKRLDLYIIAHHFDVARRPRVVLPHIKAEHDEEHTILVGQAIPRYVFVDKAFENLPTGSDLLQWLARVFVEKRSSLGDRTKERTAIADLPRGFLFGFPGALAGRVL